MNYLYLFPLVAVLFCPGCNEPTNDTPPEKVPPILISPADSSVFGSGEAVTFTWHAVGYNTPYTIEVSLSADFSNNVLIVYEIGPRTYTMEYFPYEKLTRYYWRVRGQSHQTTGYWSISRTFWRGTN